MASTEPHGNEVAFSRPRVLSELWRLVLKLRRNGNVIIFNHFKAHIVWVGIMDVKVTEEELVDFLDQQEKKDAIP